MERLYSVIRLGKDEHSFGWKQDGKWYEKNYYTEEWWFLEGLDLDVVATYYGEYLPCFEKFLKHYVELKAEKKQSGGWLSPEGIFYPAPYWGHCWLAVKIVAHLYKVVGGGMRQLEQAGWGHVSDDGEVSSFKELTQAQRDTLFDVAMLKPSLWAEEVFRALRGEVVEV
jgi:hypothetical protein